MKRWQSLSIGAGFAALIGLAAFEWFTGLLRTAPQLDLAALADIHPAVRIQINTAPIESDLVEHVRTRGGSFAPEFAIRSILPHGLTVWLAPNYTRNMIELRTLVHERRGGPLVARVLNARGAHAAIEAFAFDVNGFQAPRRGAVTLNGWFPLEQSAGTDLAEEFAANPAPPLPPMDGSHVFELHADNRNGAAYLIFASILHAFDIELSETEEKISLTSFKFVDAIALTVDLVFGDSIGIVCEMDIEPGQKDKLAVANLKAGLDELFERLGGDWNRKYGLTLTGQSEWHGDTLVFTYRVDDVPALLKALDSAR